MSDTVEFCGEQLRLADRVGMMPYMRLARIQKRISGAAESDLDDDDAAELLIAMLDLVEQCLADEEWDRFETLATKHRVDLAGIRDFTNEVMQAVGNRPTGRSSDSSDGPRTIEPSSTVVSYSPDTGSQRVVRRLNDQGRPDLALLVRRREESLSA